MPPTLLRRMACPITFGGSIVRRITRGMWAMDLLNEHDRGDAVGRGARGHNRAAQHPLASVTGTLLHVVLAARPPDRRAGYPGRYPGFVAGPDRGRTAGADAVPPIAGARCRLCASGRTGGGDRACGALGQCA